MTTEAKYTSRAAARVTAGRRVSAWVAAGILQAVTFPLAGDAAPPGKSARAAGGEFAFAGTEQCAFANAFSPPPMLQAIGPVSPCKPTLFKARSGSSRTARGGSRGASPHCRPSRNRLRRRRCSPPLRASSLIRSPRPVSSGLKERVAAPACAVQAAQRRRPGPQAPFGKAVSSMRTRSSSRTRHSPPNPYRWRA
jgi:hypothetical protein